MKFPSFQKFIQFVPEILSKDKAQGSSDFLQTILATETVFIISTMVILFLYHRFTKRKIQKIKETRESIKEKLIFFMENNEKTNFDFIVENRWDKLPIILPTIESMNHKFESNIQWLFVMNELLEKILFPLARKDAMSFWWDKRNYALRCLSLSPRKKDEAFFLNFFCDSSTHNRFGALRPLLKIGSAYSLNLIVEIMGDENRHTQAVFLSMTKFGGENFYAAIRERLIREHDPQAKRVCIDILSDSLEQSDLFLIRKDLFDKDKSLRLTALRCLGKFTIHHSTQLLIGFLDDEMWEVRSLAAKFVGARKAYQSIPLLLKNACDQNWWVRMNSIQALFDMGDSGRLALETITKEKDKYAYEMLGYVKALRDDEELRNADVFDPDTKLALVKDNPDEKKSA
ncbi:MAG: HEAT repeat domain-containing protein [Bacteriovoracaceae bacterium]|nr:HEAT repeat domain-containing protein [Bacteriovoracaceae bacterium]